MPRLVPLDLEKLTPEQKKVADAIVAGPRGGLRGPFDPWLRRPELADRAEKLGEYCRFNNSLPKDLSELAICLIGRHFKAQYEFYAHARLAREAGLSAEFVEAIRTRQTPPFKRDVEKVVYDFVTEYLATNRVSAPNYKRAIDAFGEPGVVDLVGVCGYYMLVSMTLNVFEMPLPPGEPDQSLKRHDLPPLPGGGCDHRAVSGPGILYVAARTIAGGRGEGLASSLGTAIGGLVHVLAGAVGVSALVMASAEAFTLLKLAGALYLVWLGWKTMREARTPLPPDAPSVGNRRAFRDGILVEALNPKTAAFFLAFLPQFVDPSGTVWLQFAALGLISVTLNTAVDVAVVLAASRARS